MWLITAYLFTLSSSRSSHCARWLTVRAYWGFWEKGPAWSEPERRVVIGPLSCLALTVTAHSSKRWLISCTWHQYLSRSWLRELLNRRQVEGGQKDCSFQDGHLKKKVRLEGVHQITGNLSVSVLPVNGDKMKHEIDGRIGAAPALMWCCDRLLGWRERANPRPEALDLSINLPPPLYFRLSLQHKRYGIKFSICLSSVAPLLTPCQVGLFQ